MAAVKYDLELEAGASFSLDFVYKDTDGDPIPLTGWTAQAMVRRSALEADDVDPLVDVEPVVTGAEGRVTLALTPEQTRAASRGEVWALEITDGTEVVRLAHGRVRVSPEVVR